MAYYKNPEEMYTKRADRYKREGDRQWAMAKNGEGDYHYGKARDCYREEAANRRRAEAARDAGAAWNKK